MEDTRKVLVVVDEDDVLAVFELDEREKAEDFIDTLYEDDWDTVFQIKEVELSDEEIALL